MHAMRLFVLALLICVCVLVLAACGGSHGLTKAQYGAKLNRLCLLASDQERELHYTETSADYRRDGAAIVHIDSSFVAQLRKLKAPSSIATVAAAYAGAMTSVALDDKHAVAAAQAGDGGKFHAAIALANTDVHGAWGYARAIGATGCYAG
jgi:hypothetical protein